MKAWKQVMVQFEDASYMAYLSTRRKADAISAAILVIIFIVALLAQS